MPKGGSVSAKGTTHCGGRKIRSSVIPYETLEKNHKDHNQIIPIKAKCVDSYPRFYLNNGKDSYWGNPATRH